MHRDNNLCLISQVLRTLPSPPEGISGYEIQRGADRREAGREPQTEPSGGAVTFKYERRKERTGHQATE